MSIHNNKNNHRVKLKRFSFTLIFLIKEIFYTVYPMYRIFIYFVIPTLRIKHPKN